MTEPELEPHVICLLRPAPDRVELPDAELDAIQDRHVAYQQQLHADAAADPAVVAGRLVVDVFQWWTPKDAPPL